MEVVGGFYFPCKTPPVSIFYTVGQLSASAAAKRHCWLGNDLQNCPARASHSNSPSQIHGIVLAKVMSVIAICGEYKKDPLMAAIFICFLRSKGC